MMGTNQDWKKNRGFSLLELLVVIIIIGVLVSASLISVGLIQRTNVKKAAQTVDNSLTMARTKAMSLAAYEWNVTLTKDQVSIVKVTKNSDADTGMNYSYTTVSTYEIPSNVTCSIKDKDGNSYYISDKSADFDSVSIAFEALSGEVSKVYFTSKGVVTESLNPASGIYCDLSFQYKDKESYIRVYYETGKHKVN